LVQPLLDRGLLVSDASSLRIVWRPLDEVDALFPRLFAPPGTPDLMARQGMESAASEEGGRFKP